MYDVGVKLNRYAIQETKDGQVNLFVRAPAKGFYYLTVYSTQVSYLTYCFLGFSHYHLVSQYFLKLFESCLLNIVVDTNLFCRW